MLYFLSIFNINELYVIQHQVFMVVGNISLNEKLCDYFEVQHFLHLCLKLLVHKTSGSNNGGNKCFKSSPLSCTIFTSYLNVRYVYILL